MNNGLVNHTEAEGTVRGPRSEVRGLMIILIMKKGKGRGLRRDPRPRSPPRSESGSCNKRTRLVTLHKIHDQPRHIWAISRLFSDYLAIYAFSLYEIL
eukprot:COSAG01_NODE_375_length_17945_cov_175.968284_9_plen_98_part_00